MKIFFLLIIVCMNLEVFASDSSTHPDLTFGMSIGKSTFNDKSSIDQPQIFENGIGLGFEVEYQISHWLSLDGIIFSVNDITEKRENDSSTTYQLLGLAPKLKFKYKKLTLFSRAGFGFSYYAVDYKSTVHYDSDASLYPVSASTSTWDGYAYSLGVGLHYDLSNYWKVGLIYEKYYSFLTPDPINFETSDINIQHTNIALTAKYKLNIKNEMGRAVLKYVVAAVLGGIAGAYTIQNLPGCDFCEELGFAAPMVGFSIGAPSGMFAVYLFDSTTI